MTSLTVPSNYLCELELQVLLLSMLCTSATFKRCMIYVSFFCNQEKERMNQANRYKKAC